MMGKTIDFQAVKESLAALDRIAAEHPELLGESTREEWEDILKEDAQIKEKPKKSHQALRMPEDLLEQVDEYARNLESELHISVSRSDAIRRLITIGLEADKRPPVAMV